MPFGARLVFVAAFLFPTHAGCEGEASVNGTIRCRAAFGVLAEKPMRVMRFLQSMYLSSFHAPIGWGDRERRGPLSRPARLFFGGSGADCLCSCKSRSRQSARETETRRGWNCRAQAPSAGITLKPSPDKRA